MMIDDPRTRNKVPVTNSLAEYLQWYVKTVAESLGRLDPVELQKAYELMAQARQQGRRIWVAGNGGSAAIGDHLCCDWTKGTHIPDQPALKTQSLTANTAVLTALANDCGYENVFTKQLEFQAQAGDVLVLISSSGNSPNVVSAAEWARKKSIQTIAFTGFSGGKLGPLCDVHLHVAFENYGVVEDSHQILMHVLAQFFAAAHQ